LVKVSEAMRQHSLASPWLWRSVVCSRRDWSSGRKCESREWEIKDFFRSFPVEYDEGMNGEDFCVAI